MQFRKHLSHKQSTRSLRATILTLTFVDIFSYAAISPFFALLILDTPYSITQQVVISKHFLLGALFSLFASLQVLFLPLWGHFSLFFGKRKALILVNIFSCFTYFISAVAVWYSWVWLLFVATGLAGMTSANAVLSHACLATEVTSKEESAHHYSSVGSVIGFAFLIAPCITRLLLYKYPNTQAPIFIYLFCSLSSLLNAHICAYYLPRQLDQTAKPSPKHIPSTRRTSWQYFNRHLSVEFCCFCGWYTFLKFFQVVLIENAYIDPEDSIIGLSFLGFSCTFWQGVRVVMTPHGQLWYQSALSLSLATMIFCVLAMVFTTNTAILAGVVFIIGWAYSTMMPNIYCQWM